MPSSINSLPSPTSDDDYGGTLSDSWTEVETSSVGPSVLDDLSDDSGFDSHDHDSRSESSAYSESDMDGDLLDPSVAHTHGGTDAEIRPDAGLESASELDVDTPSLAGGSYIDAEASTYRLGSSVDTIQLGLESTSSSQIRLIFPDPRSLHASAASLVSAPGVEREGVMVLPGERRASSPVKKSVDESWLRSSRLWAPALETPGKTEYRLLASYDDMEKEGQAREAIVGEVERTAEEEEQAGFAALGKDDLPVPSVKTMATKDGDMVRHSAKRWTPGMSLLTVLGVLSALSVGFLAPGLVPLTRSPAERSPAHPVIPPIATMSTGGTTDLQLIKQALSIFSTAAAAAQSKTAPGEVCTTGFARGEGGGGGVAKSRHDSETTGEGNVKPCTRCFRVPEYAPEGVGSASASTSSALALTSPAQSASLSIYEMGATQRWGRKLLWANRTAACFKYDDDDHSSSSSSSSTTRRQLAECSCSLSTLVHDQLLPQMRHSLAQAGSLVRAGARNIVRVLGQEMRDLVNVAGLAGETWLAAGRLVLSRATRGAQIVRSVYADLRSSVTGSVFEWPSPTPRAAGAAGEGGGGGGGGGGGARVAAQAAFDQTQAVLDQVSEYVELRLDALSLLIDGHAGAMQEKAGASIRKAKKGLDRVIRDAAKGMVKEGRKGVRVDGTDVGKDGPLPFRQMGKMAAGYLPAHVIMLTNVPVVNKRMMETLARRLGQRLARVGVLADELAIRVPWDDEAKTSKGIVYISLPDAQVAETALRALDGVKLGQNKISASLGAGRVERTASSLPLQPPPPPPPPAKARRVLSAIYNGAIALVV